MALRFKPEPIEQLKARYEKALERLWTVKDEASADADRPGLHRTHVFDTEDGIRLIISKHDGWEEEVWVSSSTLDMTTDGWPTRSDGRAAMARYSMISGVAVEKMQLISQQPLGHVMKFWHECEKDKKMGKAKETA